MKERFLAARTFLDFVRSTEANHELWAAMTARVRVSDELRARAAAIPGVWHLLVLVEDWCGDAVNTVPVVSRLAEMVPGLDLRVLGRDANLDLMDAHLTNGSRSIPVVMVLDEEYKERGWWGPRPAELQRWVLSAEAQALEKPERYKEVRRWYARDRGVTTLGELLTLLETVAAHRAG
ncbi:MAG TPA: thioredoxin family protein [Gemmatimonadaceae bacterium]|nr:thioredoxin family protein [Gemmatimonadaceae bacterium]